jgi:hypothetical protein
VEDHVGCAAAALGCGCPCHSEPLAAAVGRAARFLDAQIAADHALRAALAAAGGRDRAVAVVEGWLHRLPLTCSAEVFTDGQVAGVWTVLATPGTRAAVVAALAGAEAAR